MWKKLIASVSAMAIMASGAALTTLAEDTQGKEDVYMYDVVVYGGNASGVIAAIKTAQLGKTVAVVEPTPYRIGGLTTGGLGDTDVGSSGAIGGLRQNRCAVQI